MQQLIQRIEREIQPQLQALLTGMIDGSIVKSDLKDEYHMLIYEVMLDMRCQAHEHAPKRLLCIAWHL